MKPFVKMGQPADPALYERHEANGIGVYVKPNIPTRDGTLTIFSTSFLFMKALLVDGVAT